MDYWCSEEYREKNLDYKNRRAAMEDPPHHQGNLNLNGFGQRWASHNKALEPNLFVAYALAHKGSFRSAMPYDENAHCLPTPARPPMIEWTNLKGR